MEEVDADSLDSEVIETVFEVYVLVAELKEVTLDSVTLEAELEAELEAAVEEDKDSVDEELGEP